MFAGGGLPPEMAVGLVLGNFVLDEPDSKLLAKKRVCAVKHNKKTQKKRVGYMLTTKQAGERLGVTDARVRVLLTEGRLSGEKFGRDWLVSRESVENYQLSRRPAGRPKKIEAQAS